MHIEQEARGFFEAALAEHTAVPVQSFSDSPITFAGHFWFKRIFDILGSVVALAFFAPFFAVIAVLIFLNDRGPVVFGHVRVGRDGRKFKCLKFRTMVQNADERLAHLLEQDEAAREEWADTRKLKNDPRILSIGHFLRKSSLDELPQLINVLRGEMSLVGPRPIPEDELTEQYSVEGRKVYLSCRPGLTGLWQVSGRNDTSYAQRVCFDVKYYNQQSVLLDTQILFKTVGVLLWGRGAY